MRRGCGTASSASAITAAPPGGTFADGVSRVAYSVADLTARAWIIDELKQAEIAPRIDAAGNIYGRFGGQPNQPAILFGSHIDSVPNGGNFDGDLGTFAAIEVIQAVQAAKIQTRHPLEMVVWAHEESTAFGAGTAASRIVAGDLQAGDMDKVWNGMKRSDAIRRIAGDPDQIETAVRGKGTWHAYVELHIEQGGTLDKAKVPIGIVEGIVAIHRYDVVIEGFANHAGTTPMGERQDAMVAAVAADARGARDRARPQGPPGRHRRAHRGRAELAERDSRPRHDERRVPRSVRGHAEGTRRHGEGARRRDREGDQYEDDLYAGEHESGGAGVQGRAGRHRPLGGLGRPEDDAAAERRGPRCAADRAIVPMGMIFVPSIGGISHSPRELTSWDDCVNGANVLLRTVLALDQRDSI